MYKLYNVYKKYIKEPLMEKVTTADARKNFAEVVNQVAYGKEPVVLTRRGKELAA